MIMMLISLWGGNIWAIPTTILLPFCPCICYCSLKDDDNKTSAEDDYAPLTEENES